MAGVGQGDEMYIEVGLGEWKWGRRKEGNLFRIDELLKLYITIFIFYPKRHRK